MNTTTHEYFIRHLGTLERFLINKAGQRAQPFKNDVFEFNIYYDAEQNWIGRYFKCGDFQVQWFRKTDGVNYLVDSSLSKADVLDMMSKCLNSLK